MSNKSIVRSGGNSRGVQVNERYDVDVRVQNTPKTTQYREKHTFTKTVTVPRGNDYSNKALGYGNAGSSSQAVAKTGNGNWSYNSRTTRDYSSSGDGRQSNTEFTSYYRSGKGNNQHYRESYRNNYEY